MPRLASFAFSILLIATWGTACGPPRLVLPAGPGTPAADYAGALSSALAHCRAVRTLQAELGLSGRVGRQRIRGHVLGGFAPEALRLEAVSPLGSPAFILVAEGSRGTLLLLRDRRVLEDAPPAEILEALVGIKLGPDDLRAMLSGCVTAGADTASSARGYGPDWMSVELASGGTVFLQRRPTGWRIAGGRYSAVEIAYSRFAGDVPAQIRVVDRRSSGVDRPAPGESAAVSLTIDLSQVDVKGELPRERLVAVKMPPGLLPITLQELRDAGPLGR